MNNQPRSQGPSGIVKSDKMRRSKGWTKEEEEILVKMVKEHQHNETRLNWRKICDKVGKTKDACYAKYKRLNPIPKNNHNSTFIRLCVKVGLKPFTSGQGIRGLSFGDGEPEYAKQYLNLDCNTDFMGFVHQVISPICKDCDLDKYVPVVFVNDTSKYFYTEAEFLDFQLSKKKSGPGFKPAEKHDEVCLLFFKK